MGSVVRPHTRFFELPFALQTLSAACSELGMGWVVVTCRRGEVAQIFSK